MSKLRVIVKPGGFVAVSMVAMVLVTIGVYIVATQPELFRRSLQTILKPQDVAKESQVQANVFAIPATISASNVFENDSAYAASNVMDKDTNTRWASDSGTKQAWLQADFAPPVKIEGSKIREEYGDRVRKFELQYQAPGDAKWMTLASGTHLGENYEIHFSPVQAQAMRLNILDSTEGPTISEVAFLSAK